ncbi:hypothetical protein [uncultured Jatrophihabitans sp.]|uniref:hypothetical protein n=1 Tax=uncultured Jatrophihabitans sp. TaxID=1610747 RepID=UPI0035CA4B9D
MPAGDPIASLYDHPQVNPFAGTIDRNRCQAIGENETGEQRRCQQFVDHPGPHASGRVIPYQPSAATTWEWEDGEQPQVVRDVGPRRWCAFQWD